MPQLNTAEAVAAALVANGIDTLFCVPGVQNDVLMDAFYHLRDKVRIIHTRHEQGAAYMALGAAMATGKPQVYAVVPGPGFLNSTAALATAYACNAPVLALVGQIPQQHIGRGHGFLHEIPDQLGVMRSLTKWAARIDAPQDAPELVEEAFRQMRSGRPRPVGLECAVDVWPRAAEVRDSQHAFGRTDAIHHDAIETAAALLGAAKRPLMLIGGGAQHASAEVTALAEWLQLPVAAGQMGLGVIDARNPLSIPLPVAHKLWRDADVVLAVGTRLQVQQMNWGIDADLKIIRIDIDAEEIARFAPPAVGIVGDAAEALAALLKAVCGRHPARKSPASELSRARTAFEAEVSGLQPQLDYLQAIRAALPEDGILVDEVTQLGHAARFGYRAYRPRTFITPGYQGTLGWGYATALGVKVARPHCPVVSINGDGGFMFNVQEMATAVRHGIAVVAVVFDDGAYGNVRRSQEMRYGNRLIAWDLANPDFVALAESFGIKAMRAKTPGELSSALVEALQTNEPQLIHVPVGPMPDPWKFVHLPRVRGQSLPSG
jgi:acetolactate synthase-1/2/3 large subunit